MDQYRFAYRISLSLASKVIHPDHVLCMPEVNIGWLWWSSLLLYLMLFHLWPCISLQLWAVIQSSTLLDYSVSSLSSQTTTQSIYDNNSLPHSSEGLNILSLLFSLLKHCNTCPQFILISPNGHSLLCLCISILVIGGASSDKITRILRSLSLNCPSHKMEMSSVLPSTGKRSRTGSNI